LHVEIHSIFMEWLVQRTSCCEHDTLRQRARRQRQAVRSAAAARFCLSPRTPLPCLSLSGDRLLSLSLSLAGKTKGGEGIERKRSKAWRSFVTSAQESWLYVCFGNRTVYLFVINNNYHCIL
jgi:hypothetical protein